MGWIEYPQLVDLLARPLAEGFLAAFLLTLYWLLGSYFSERMGERVGAWQALPRWLQARTKDNGDRVHDDRREPSKGSDQGKSGA